MTIYDLAYKMIPGLAKEFLNSHLEKDDLFDERAIILALQKQGVDFDLTEFSVESLRLDGQKIVGVYTFPTPDRPVEAKFGLLFFDENDKDFRYYTLEKAHKYDELADDWMIGVTDKSGNRKNLGGYGEGLISDTFLQYIHSRY